ncbi:hypothetical protein GCM10008018_01890 [Paenibacillus marchantiophytorum]|uniref:Phage tail tape measure protein n=1 Tax=Paenibacillus marchantiophytorum TaxID=1619310 RepID=A0ABQ2BMT1_9BACL|nr:hypothetical protein [Paenibacillus marchantiophytorum]GGI43402.1 hypothetical protein GCM10008018_01890 [Paenibacillus marchantiophytorum]
MRYEKLEDLLDVVNARLLKVKGCHYLIRSLTIGIVLACIWMIGGRFFLINFYRNGAWGSVVLAVITASVWLYLHRPRHQDAAQIMDKHGLEDRISTALKYAEQTSVLADLQRQDALHKANLFVDEQLTKVVVYRITRKQWMPGAIALFVFGLLLILPNSNDSMLKQDGKERQWVADQQKQVAEFVKELETKPSPLPAMKQVAEDLNELERRLAQTPTTAKALEELEKSLKKMETTIGDMEKQQKRSEQWADSMQRTEALRELGKTLEQKQTESMQSELAKLGEQVQKMTPEQKQQLASELERLAASAAAASPEAEQQLREQLQQAASALRSGEDPAAQLGQLQAGLAAASAAQQALAQQQAQAAQAAASLAAGALPQARQLAASGAQPGQAWAPGGRAERLAAAGSAPAPNAGAAAAGAPGAAPPGSGAGGPAGAGAGGTPGSGPGQSGGPGGGVGGTQGGTGAGSRGLVTTPRERSGTGGTFADGGPTSGSGGEVSQGGKAPAIDGASRPYEDVYAEYAAEASSALNRSELPQHMQNRVRDYFLEIQPQR